MKKFLTILFLAVSTLSFADQLAYISKADADRAVAKLEKMKNWTSQVFYTIWKCSPKNLFHSDTPFCPQTILEDLQNVLTSGGQNMKSMKISYVRSQIIGFLVF